MTFDLHIGIDYSGRETPHSRTPTPSVMATIVHCAFDDDATVLHLLK